MNKIEMYIWKKRMKKLLIRCFKLGDITRRYEESSSNRHVYYPKIHHVAFEDNYVSFIFTLLNGINPELLEEKFYIFQQVFGKNITLEGEIKRYELKVYFEGLPQLFNYQLDEWKDALLDKDIPIVCGVNINGEQISFDMAENPHILLTGETGSGKSSLLRVILTSLVLSKSDEELQFILGDLKKSEFGLYRNLKHVQGVHMYAKDLFQSLKQLRKEMDRRGELLDEYEVTHIKDLPIKLPYIILCIDEFALLKKEKAIMQVIEDVSSVGRALGVLLILSCQRADSKLMEGILKNNLTIRISGRQSNSRNSNIAGVPSAHKIKMSDKGRMYLMLDKEIEIQSPHLTYEEAKSLLSPYIQTKESKVDKPNEEFTIWEEE